MDTSLALQEEVFLTALRLDSEKQAQYLNQMCADDPELREKIVSLIKAHAGETKILDKQSQFSNDPRAFARLIEGTAKEVVDPPNPAACKPGEQIGCYKLLEEIGEGGMGLVFMAEQVAPVRRKVALKIVKLGMDTRNVIARFEAERQALAMMDHASITKVLDAGTTQTGRPYFVMELVRGKSIKEYCDQNRLSIKQRVELFVQVCQAVQHAHQKGVIHRDIKPSNILVASQDSEPTPKIIDFGIAKATNRRLTEKTLFTGFGDMIGTVDYMSPEQAELSGDDIDTRSDIYSLGVVLYELLTGTTPLRNLRKMGLKKISETIRTQEPEKPSTRVVALDETAEEVMQQRGIDRSSLSRSLRGDLDWIVLKCLSKDRADRYETAADLARDLKRSLNGEPVDAAAPSTLYRLTKLYHRHRLPILGAATVSALLATAFVFCLVMAIYSFREARRAEAAERLAETRLEKLQEISSTRMNELEARKLQLQAQSRNQLNRIAVQNAHERYLVTGVGSVNNEIQTGFEIGPEFEFASREIEQRVTSFRVMDAVPFSMAAHGTFAEPTAVDGFVYGQDWVEQSFSDSTAFPIPNSETHPPVILSTVVPLMPTDMCDTMMFPGMLPYGIWGYNEMEIPFTNPGYQIETDSNGESILVTELDFDTHHLDLLELVLEEQRKSFGPNDEFLGRTLILIAERLIGLEQWAESEDRLRQCLDTFKNTRAEFPEMPVRANLLLAVALAEQGKEENARVVFKEAESKLAVLQSSSPELNAIAEYTRQRMTELLN